MRQFKRMRQPRATHLRLIWPGQPAWCLPVPNALFQGDTLHAFAGFDEIPEGSVRLLYDLDDGTTQEARAVLQTWPGTPETLARLAVAKRLVQAEEEEGETSLSDTTRTELAVRYNLVSDLTHYLVVHERAEGEKAEDLPEVAKVLQMQAAGWGGTSTVLACMSGVAGAGTDQIRYSKRRSSSAVDFDMPTMMRNRRVSEAPPALRMSHHRRSIASGRTTMRSFLGDILSSFGNNQSISGTATAFLQKLDQRLASRLRGRLPNRLETLSRLGLDQTIVNALAALAQTEGLSEAEVIVVFLSVMDCNGWLSSLCRASRMRLDDAVGLQMMNSHHHELVQQILVGTDFERELASTAASDDGLESLTIPEFLRKQAE